MKRSKEQFNSLIDNFESLLQNFEDIAEHDLRQLSEKRIADIDSGKVKGKTEKEFLQLLKDEEM